MPDQHMKSSQRIQPIAAGDLEWAGFCYSSRPAWTVTIIRRLLLNHPADIFFYPFLRIQRPAFINCLIIKTEMNCPPLHSGTPPLYPILLSSLLHPHFTQTPFCHQVFHTDFLHPIIIRLSQKIAAYSPHRSSITSATVSIFSHCHALYPQKSRASSVWPLAARISARLMQ